ncbi:MAG: cupin domain-containing protein [Fimbriimonas sp.]
MPILQGPNRVPDVAAYAAWGLAFHAAGEIDPIPLHFHDCDEYYFIVEGRLKVQSEGIEYEMAKGDVLFTRMGDEHAILEVYEDTKLFWLEGPLQGRKRLGHLFRGIDDVD